MATVFDTRVERAAEIIADALRTLTAEERADVLYSVRQQYCLRCGNEQSRTFPRCQCWNDD